MDNFRRELDPDQYAAANDRRTAAMRRDLDYARAAITRLETEIDLARHNLAREEEEVARCQHRENLARQIADDETARIAAEYATRHAERAAIIRQKIAALSAEHDLLRREASAMRDTLAQLGPRGQHANHEAHYAQGEHPPDPNGPYSGQNSTSSGDDHHNETEFQRLEDDARARAAEVRLEELKRKMRP